LQAERATPYLSTIVASEDLLKRFATGPGLDLDQVLFSRAD
jgi:hypothetical protein